MKKLEQKKMNIFKRSFIVTMIIIVAMLNLFCPGGDEAFEGDERGDFTWNTVLRNHNATWKVHCDSVCETCRAEDTVFTWKCVYDSVLDTNICNMEPVYYNIELNKQTYDKVYAYCRGLPYVGAAIDTSSHLVVPTGKVVFQRDLGAHYWFDDWRNRETGRFSKISYVSIPKDSNTAFCIYIGEGLMDAVDSVVASIPLKDVTKLSFDRGGTKNRVKLAEGYNSINAYPLTGAAIGDIVEIFVHGYYDISDTLCLAGDCLGSEDRLKVIMFPDSAQGQTAGITNYYDQNGRLIRSVKVSDKYLIYDVIYTYDAKGNRLSSKTASSRPW